jgi:hypothetical protein
MASALRNAAGGDAITNHSDSIRERSTESFGSGDHLPAS